MHHQSVSKFQACLQEKLRVAALGLTTFISVAQMEPRPDSEICPCQARELRRWEQLVFHASYLLQPSSGSHQGLCGGQGQAKETYLIQVLPASWWALLTWPAPLSCHESSDSSPVHLEPASTVPIQQSKRAVLGAVLEMPSGLIGGFFFLFSEVCGGRGWRRKLRRP